MIFLESPSGEVIFKQKYAKGKDKRQMDIQTDKEESENANCSKQ